MKKFKVLGLALLVALSLSACGADTSTNTESSVTKAEGVTAAAFTLDVCGVTVTNETLASCDLYTATAETVNSEGNAKSDEYVGYKLSDILNACNITGDFGKLTATATDGYEVTYDGDVLAETVFIAVQKNGESFKEAPWFAPCSSDTTGDFLKGLAKLSIEGAEASK